MRQVLLFLATLMLAPTPSHAAGWKNIVGGTVGALLDSGEKTPRPSDWRAYSLPVTDSREGKKSKICNLEIIEIGRPFAARGSVLLIPGFMENAFAWDIQGDPETNTGISYARYLHTLGFRTYVLHFRGVGQSCYPKKSNLDDLAVDDIPAALRWVRAREGGPVYAVGHSMGGLTLMSSMAGLTRRDLMVTPESIALCEKGKDAKNCFDWGTALARQSLVNGIMVLGANLDMRVRDTEIGLKAGTQFERLLSLMPSFLVDRVSRNFLGPIGSTVGNLIDDTTDLGSVAKEPLLHLLIWRYYFTYKNVSPEIKERFQRIAIDSTSRGVLDQYSKAIRGDGLRTIDGEQRYSDFLPYIQLPVAQGSFSKDIFADEIFTFEDTFKRFGSQKKFYRVYEGEGHQDFMLNANLHAHTADLWDALQSP